MCSRHGLQFSLLITLIIVSFTTNSLTDGLAVASSNYDWQNDYASEVLSGVNQERNEQNIDSLQEDAQLQQAAQMKADDMASRGYFSHETPDGKDPWYWLDKNDIEYTKAGENLAIKFEDPAGVVPAWMNSPKHKKNVLNANYTQTGIGIATGQYEGQEVIFVVELYVKP